VGGKGGRCLGLTRLPPACADCLEIREPQPAVSLWACTGIALPFTPNARLQTIFAPKHTMWTVSQMVSKHHYRVLCSHALSIPNPTFV